MFEDLNMDIIDKNLFIIGICSIFNAYGIRFLWEDLHLEHKQWLLGIGLKKVVIFTLLFVTTRNFLVSLLLLILYSIFKKYVKLNVKNNHLVFN
jgi:hypothetical protein